MRRERESERGLRSKRDGFWEYRKREGGSMEMKGIWMLLLSKEKRVGDFG